MQEVSGEVLMLVEEEWEEMSMVGTKMPSGELPEEQRGAHLIEIKIVCVLLVPSKIKIYKDAKDWMFWFPVNDAIIYDKPYEIAHIMGAY